MNYEIWISIGLDAETAPLTRTKSVVHACNFEGRIQSALNYTHISHTFVFLISSLEIQYTLYVERPLFEIYYLCIFEVNMKMEHKPQSLATKAQATYEPLGNRLKTKTSKSVMQ